VASVKVGKRQYDTDVYLRDVRAVTPSGARVLIGAPDGEIWFPVRDWRSEVGRRRVMWPDVDPDAALAAAPVMKPSWFTIAQYLLAGHWRFAKKLMLERRGIASI